MMILEVRVFQPISPFHDAHLPSLIIQSLPGTGKIVMRVRYTSCIILHHLYTLLIRLILFWLLNGRSTPSIPLW